VRTIEWYHARTDDGYVWSTAVQHFLAGFGNLTIDPIRSEAATFGSGPFEIEPDLVIGERERIAHREDTIGESLCPVGEWSGESIVLISPSRRVYAETSYQVLLLGQSPEEALDVIVRAHRYPELVSGTVWWMK